MSLTITDLVGYLQDGARNAGISDTDNVLYSLAEKQRAVQGILYHFVRETKCSRQTSSVAITLDSVDVNFTAVTGFARERVVDEGIYVNESADYSAIDVRNGVSVCDYDQIAQARGCRGTDSGTPTMIAFLSNTAAKIWRTPKATGTISVTWSPLLTTGTTDFSSIPDDMAITAVRTGGVCWLQNGQVENLPFTTQGPNSLWNQYLSHVELSKGRVGSPVKSFVRKRVHQRHRPPVWPEIVGQ